MDGHLNTFLYEGEAGMMTFMGPISYRVAFNLIMAEDADPDQQDNAARVIALFIMDARISGDNETRL